jgi:hypothetical protein
VYVCFVLLDIIVGLISQIGWFIIFLFSPQRCSSFISDLKEKCEVDIKHDQVVLLP